ncbi:general secretion pathway protein J [Roseivivax lentus]|uniref:General secretion pathway protein J n=1 Tax=Roseivivax lentus TaxID=633194 RepID=A0A1N7NB74_9RHOB|nr:prepilin-type N-terminal cleavage/methylation domain-containing protein [Roseivivax lentus]SIS95471.1 general secretion pathway protein J [Roseivivax lentus]
MKAPQRDAGLSLLELVAVLAIFSVVALMGVQLLSQAMSNRDRLLRADARVTALTAVIAVLRRDLEQAIPQPDRSGKLPVFAIAGNSIRLAAPDGAGSTAILWRHDPSADRLVREGATGDAATLQLADVGAMRVDIFGETGWSDGQTWRADGPADLPDGVRVVLSLNDMGDVPIVVAR